VLCWPWHLLCARYQTGIHAGTYQRVEVKISYFSIEAGLLAARLRKSPTSVLASCLEPFGLAGQQCSIDQAVSSLTLNRHAVWAFVTESVGRNNAHRDAEQGRLDVPAEDLGGLDRANIKLDGGSDVSGSAV
jgi:hypothetical protein